MAVTDKWLRAQLGKPRDEAHEENHNGVFIRISPKGKISFYMRYRLDGKQHRYGLGGYPATSLGDAVQKREAVLAQVDAGEDPKLQDKLKVMARETEMGFRIQFDNWYDEKERKGRENDNQRYKAIQNHIFPVIGELPVGSLTYKMLFDLLEGLAKRIPSQTSDMLTNLKKFFDYMVHKDIIEYPHPLVGLSNKSFGIKKKPRRRVLEAEEIRAVWAAFDRRTANLDPRTGLLGKGCLLTGCRNGEFVELQAEEYRRSERLWVKNEHKNFNSEKMDTPIFRFVGPYAASIIEQALEIAGDGMLYPVKKDITSGRKRSSNTSQCERHIIWIRDNIDRDFKKFSLHDLRRTFRTIVGGLKSKRLVSDKFGALTQGHKEPGIETVYDLWTYRDDIKEGYEIYEKYLMFVLASEYKTHLEAMDAFAEEYIANGNKPAAGAMLRAV